MLKYSLMSRTNEARHTEWHETCKYKYRLDASVCNNKKHLNDDICRCEWKELIDKGVCDKRSIWNPSNCECECDKSCELVNIQTVKTVSAGKIQLMNQFRNVLKMLKKQKQLK